MNCSDKDNCPSCISDILKKILILQKQDFDCDNYIGCDKPYLGPNNGNTWIVKGITSNDITISGSDNFDSGDIEDNFEDVTLKTFDMKKYSKVLENAISHGIKIYNDAYISCANKAFGYDRKHDNHLALLNKIFNIDKAHVKI